MLFKQVKAKKITPIYPRELSSKEAILVNGGRRHAPLHQKQYDNIATIFYFAAAVGIGSLLGYAADYIGHYLKKALKPSSSAT